MAILTIGGVAVANPSDFKVSRVDFSSAETGRTQRGKMIKDIVARKVTLDCQWNTLSWSATSALLTAVEASEFLEVIYPDPKEGTYVTKIFYVGDRNAPALMLADGKEYWGGISFTLIEQ